VSGQQKPAGAKPAFQVSLKGRALRLLGQREHTRLELERKLGRYEEEPGTLAQALDELQAKGYLNEQRAAESLVHRRAGQYGAMRLRQEMQDKGVARELIDQTLAGVKDTELSRALEVWRRKFDVLPATPQERARQIRFLQARGFSADIVARLLKPKDTAES
jgi:regulatory protein